jgi:Protein of unknown function (DUF2927)
LSPRRLLPLAAALALFAAGPARADRLDDDLNTVWEALWDERGTPARVVRWAQPLRWRMSGKASDRDRATVLAALAAVTQAAGLSLAEATPDAEPNLTVEFVDDETMAAEGSNACEAHTSRQGSALHSVRLRLASRQVWECAFHEAMHAMGIPGHPSGKTVLSYFGWRRDVLLPLDRLLLAVWYDPTLPRGATPFEALWVAGQHVIRQADLGLSPEVAEQRRRANHADRLREMGEFARGQGDVPRIVRRSSRASGGHIDEARLLVAYYLGLAHRQGTGVAADPVEAHRWLAAAIKGGMVAASFELERLEQRMAPAELERARALGPR